MIREEKWRKEDKKKPCFVTLRPFFSFLFPLSSFPIYLGTIEVTLLAG